VNDEGILVLAPVWTQDGQTWTGTRAFVRIK
jgi:hypothetical protein